MSNSIPPILKSKWKCNRTKISDETIKPHHNLAKWIKNKNVLKKKKEAIAIEKNMRESALDLKRKRREKNKNKHNDNIKGLKASNIQVINKTSSIRRWDTKNKKKLLQMSAESLNKILKRD